MPNYPLRDTTCKEAGLVKIMGNAKLIYKCVFSFCLEEEKRPWQYFLCVEGCIF